MRSAHTPHDYYQATSVKKERGGKTPGWDDDGDGDGDDDDDDDDGVVRLPVKTAVSLGLVKHTVGSREAVTLYLT